MCWFWRGRKTGVPGEKPSKHRRDQLRELNSHEMPHQTWFQWWEAQRVNRLRHPCFPGLQESVFQDLSGEDYPYMWFRPAIFIWFVFAQFFFIFYQNGDIQKLNTRCIQLWKSYFHTINIECRLRHSEVRLLFFDTPCIYTSQKLDSWVDSKWWKQMRFIIKFCADCLYSQYRRQGGDWRGDSSPSYLEIFLNLKWKVCGGYNYCLN